MVLLFFIFGLVQSQTGCEDGWTEFNGSCYKYVDNHLDRGTFDVLRARCQALGADIASGAKHHERVFLDKLNRLSMPRGFPEKYPGGQNWDHLLVGVNYADDGKYTKISVNPGETVDDQFHYCPNEPNYFRGTEFCHFMYSTDKPDQAPFCMIDVNCNFKWRRYVCRKDKPRDPELLLDTVLANNIDPPHVPLLSGPKLDGSFQSEDELQEEVVSF